MKKIKKLSDYIILISIVIISGLFPCCKKSEKYKIGVSQCSSDDWRTKMNEELLLESMLHGDVMLEIRSADDDSNKQIQDIQYFVDNGYDIIIVAPNEAEPLTPVIREVYESGMPVIIFDRNINDTTYTQRIGVDNIGLGQDAAEYALNMIPDSLRVIEVYGLKGSTPAEERNQGFLSVITSSKGKIVASATADWTKEKAESVVDSMLRQHPETNLIFAHNDRMAIGASEVAERQNRNDIKIIGIDAAPNIGIKAVKDGVIDVTFLYPTEGAVIFDEAIKILSGQPYEKELVLPLTSAVNQTNADILLRQYAEIEEDTNKIRRLKSQLDDYLSRHSAQTILFYAIIVILLLLFVSLFLVLRTFWQHRRHQEVLMRQNKLLEEERDKQKELNIKLEEATQSKLVFFTNVSHDLRTPLTLISEPVAQLNNASNLDSQQKTLMKIADKNIKILQRLINQILDFRKYENNKMDLNLSQINFREVIEEWFDSFKAISKKRHITLTLEEPPLMNGDFILALDVEKIERVFFNLVSNAFKYSPDKSSIKVSYSIDGSNLVIKVADTGIGISKEDLASIFDSFYQVDRVRPRGSGIGLSLAKAFVELHGGTITVESELNKGSVFTVSLPIRHVSKEVEKVESGIREEDIEAELEDIEAEINIEEDKPLLLIIDDNKDIREMIGSLMHEEYNVISAADGKDGIRKAGKYVPDIIICDVMMPGIDGMETCGRLKSEEVTSHIPVLMLTACAMDEQRVQGFESGADGYISKPFSLAVLKSQVASLISNRRRIKNIYEKSGTAGVLRPDTDKVVPKNAGVIDADFYNRFLEVFEKEMGNPDINVESLASSLGYERTQLYRKLKAITNYSPVELMRNLRLKKAKKLLITTEKSISEISYEVGFSTPAYFTKCFREQYGKTPSEIREKE